MRTTLFAIAALLPAVAASQIPIDTFVELDGEDVIDVDPAICTAHGISYSPDTPLTLRIERIVCSDRIFTNGFEGD